MFYNIYKVYIDLMYASIHILTRKYACNLLTDNSSLLCNQKLK